MRSRTLHVRPRSVLAGGSETKFDLRAARRRSDLDVGAEHPGPLVNAHEAPAGTDMDVRHVESDAVVDDRKAAFPRLLDQGHLGLAASAVSGDVRHTFLSDAE